MQKHRSLWWLVLFLCGMEVADESVEDVPVGIFEVSVANCLAKCLRLPILQKMRDVLEQLHDRGEGRDEE